MAAATRSAAQDPTNSVKQESTANPSDPKDGKKTSPRSEPANTVKAEGGNAEENSKAAANAPLAPPPAPKSSLPSSAKTPDFFSGGGSHFSLEPNPFEQSFGNPAADTPGKFAGLPSVASLTSPAPLGPGGTPGWSNSLRSGPLSPAMLAGPTNNGGGYFDSEFRNSFPTPNESSLRTGLTPGGTGSMFPAPSPNSQAIFNSMQTGGATPGTLDFHRTAMNAAARSKLDAPATSAGPSQPENDAVNSLYMLANNSNRSSNSFAVPGQPAHANSARNGGAATVNGTSTSSHDRAGKGSIGGISNATDEGSDGLNDSGKSAKGSKAKKGAANGKAGAVSAAANANNRRKADEPPVRAPTAKRQKGASEELEDDDDDDEDDDEDEDGQLNGKGNGNGQNRAKMTDDEKRKNFLERNRVAALKCRQRKKQWLANLQSKVEVFSSENDALTVQCSQMQDEIMYLKRLLFAHKDCAVSHQQGLGGNNMAQVLGGFDPPPTMGMPGGQGMMAGQHAQGMQRN